MVARTVPQLIEREAEPMLLRDAHNFKGAAQP
jgi:hypothetical protein